MADRDPASETGGPSGPGSDGRLRTVFVFRDLPRHVEFKAGDLPMIPKGEVIHFDFELRNPVDPKRVRKIEGRYKVADRVLRYSTSRSGLLGMTQYLELEPER